MTDQVRAALAALSDLREKDLSAQGVMVLEGRIVIQKAISLGIEILLLVCSTESGAPWLSEDSAGFPILRMDHAEICSLVGFKFHHGAVAVARRPVIRPAEPGLGFSSYLCLWNVTDPSNVGALLRSAAGLGVQAVLLGPGCADPFYRKALRASMGNALSLPLFSCDAEGIKVLGDSGVEFAAATLSERSIPLEAFIARRRRSRRAAAPLALVLGNEGFGLPWEVASLCRGEVVIPMEGGTDSLNVVVAGAILMYGLFRRR